MGNTNQKIRQPWGGMQAKFRAKTSEQLKRTVERLANQPYEGTEHTISGMTAEITVTFNRRGMRCDWQVGDDPNPVASLIQSHGETPVYAGSGTRLES
jgi:hypothetical protein